MGRLMVLSEAPLARGARRAPSPWSALRIAALMIAAGTATGAVPVDPFFLPENLAQLAVSLVAYLAGVFFSLVAVVRVSRCG